MKFSAVFVCSLALAVSAFAAGKHEKSDKPLSISQGAQVNLTEFVVPGKTTVFIFTSEYFQPCRAYAEPLFQLHRQRDDIAVVKVDINRAEIHEIDWDSPVVRQYGIRSLPFFKICGPDGKLIVEGKSARPIVDKWISALQ